MVDTAATGNKSVGERGEAIAAAYLKGQSFRILERNFRCRAGEVDIIACDGKTVVFVEVKARTSLAFGPPQLAVGPIKQRQISKAALTWLAQHRLHDAGARFDVVAILLRDHEVPQIEHFRNAFDLAYG